MIFIVWAILCSLHSNAQQDPSHTFLNITSVADPEEETETIVEDDAAAPADSVQNLVTQTPSRFRYIFFDLGTADLNNSVNGAVQSAAHGPTFAFSWQAAYKINSGNNDKRMFLSAGLELRNFNTKYTIIDPEVGIAHDYLHFWYIGVPLMYQYVNTHHTPGNKNDVNGYFQAGLYVGYKAAMNHSRNDGGVSAEDHSSAYNNLLLQPYISAGISYTTETNVYLIGPFVAYGMNDISTQSTVNTNFSSYGIRLSALLFK